MTADSISVWCGAAVYQQYINKGMFTLCMYMFCNSRGIRNPNQLKKKDNVFVGERSGS